MVLRLREGADNISEKGKGIAPRSLAYPEEATPKEHPSGYTF